MEGSGNENGNEKATKRVFEVFVETLEGDQHLAQEALLVRLRYFGADIETTLKRLQENPEHALSLIASLSRMMQEIDTEAGRASSSRETVTQARRFALLIPEASDIVNT